MKQNERKNMISIIQNNLKQMHQQAQIYLDKHHGSLPPICSARHYLFHTLDNKNQYDPSSPQIRSSMSYKYSKKSQQKQKSQPKQIPYKPKKTIYNLQFKKLKNNQPNHDVSRNSLMNSTSMRLKMMGSWRNSRYTDNLSQRYIDQDYKKDKMKMIVMNSQIVQMAQKDLKITNNSFSPRLSKLQLPKKQSDVLKKYLNRFKEAFSQQLQYQQSQQQDKPKIQQIFNKSNQLIEVCLPHQKNDQLTRQNTQSIRKRRLPQKTLQNPQTISKTKRSKLQKQLSYISKTKPIPKKKQYDIVEGDCSPWNGDQKIQEFNNFDFS